MQRLLRAVAKYLLVVGVCCPAAVHGLECMVGIQECHCGWACTGGLDEAASRDLDAAHRNQTCQRALPLLAYPPARTCPGNADVCLYYTDIQLAPYLNGTVVGRARFGNCYRPGTGTPANQSTYYPVFTLPDTVRHIDGIGARVGPQGFAGQNFLCSRVDYERRPSGEDEYAVYCLCRLNKCNLDLQTMGALPVDPGKDVDARIVDLYKNPNTSAPTLTPVEINNTPAANATRRPDTMDAACGTHPDSEDCNSPATRSGATQLRHQAGRLWCVLAGWTLHRVILCKQSFPCHFM
ncbi:uncharacterized protein LOC129587978 [Paramacrobiotus metropolitanus]|uniref:uncharacterized protein LOC129587978 n=1 Tax=Paramacrobiotus metropolitanus TaxID=2943436 RepID=UPI002445C3B4|nr:uncharacterized protein LOC129587978 [Paramacrobiotus metropolitanus]